MLCCLCSLERRDCWGRLILFIRCRPNTALFAEPCRVEEVEQYARRNERDNEARQCEEGDAEVGMRGKVLPRRVAKCKDGEELAAWGGGFLAAVVALEEE